MERLTGVSEGWDFLAGERPRGSLNERAVALMNALRWFMPPKATPRFVEMMSDHFFGKRVGGKFAPFADEMRAGLAELYQQDLEAIAGMGG